MKCKVLYFLLCVALCFSLLSLNSSAVNDLSVDDLFEMGYVYDGVCYALPEGVPDPFYSIPSILIANEPNYPDFEPKRIPWSDAPEYIQDIIYMSLDSAAATETSEYKMPFVLIRVTSSTASVYVGYNVGLGYDLANERMRICVTEYFYDNSVCYQATFNTSDYSVTSDWRKLTSTLWGAEEISKVKSYSSTLAYLSSNYDFYMYGGNGVRAGSFTSANFALHSATENCYFVVDNTIGFQSGRFFYNDVSSTNIFCEYFVPPSLEQIEQETSKGIWETLKSIPDVIADKFKGLFIPEEGYFDAYTKEFQDYFSERFGILYELPEAMIDILQQFIDFKPVTEGYYIPIPEVVLPIRLEDGTYEDFVILEKQNYVFDFLSEGAFATLYSFYRSFVWLIFVLSLIGLAIRKYNRITGGGG